MPDRTPTLSTTIQIDAAEEGPRFLGLRVAERNRRVIARAARSTRWNRNGGAGVLTIPAGVAVTAGLVEHLAEHLSEAPGTTRLVWDPSRPPLILRSAAPSADENTRESAAAAPASRTIVLPPGLVLDVSTPRARRQASWHLLKASGKPRDGWLSRHIHRKVSRVFSYVFLQLGLTADIATLLTCGVGVLAAWFLAQTTHGTMVAGAALYWFSSIADGIDGEMARLTLSESPYGESLDTAVDQLTHLVALGGVIVGWWRQGMGPAAFGVAAAVVLGVPAVLLWLMALVRRAHGTHRLFVPAKPIELAISRAARETGALPLRLAAAVFILFRREAFSLTFFVVSLATAERVVVPALIACALLVVVATVAAYHARIERALRENHAAREQ